MGTARAPLSWWPTTSRWSGRSWPATSSETGSACMRPATARAPAAGWPSTSPTWSCSTSVGSPRGRGSSRAGVRRARHRPRRSRGHLGRHRGRAPPEGARSPGGAGLRAPPGVQPSAAAGAGVGLGPRAPGPSHGEIWVDDADTGSVAFALPAPA